MVLTGVDNRTAGAGAAAVGTLAYFLYNRQANAAEEKPSDDKYQGGESYADPKKIETGLLDDIKVLASKGKLISSALTLREVAKEKGKPVDDKKMTVRVTVTFEPNFD